MSKSNMEVSGLSLGTSATNSSKIPQYILDDLCARFVINVPEEESRDPIRVFFQIELAHWFYLDFYCPENPELRQLNIKEFSNQIFRHCPSLTKYLDKFDSLWESWKEYKSAVPTYGAILLDPSLQHCLLVQGYWVKASWGFPKGKVNQDEAPIDCAIREVFEETGFDISHLINPQSFVECRLNEQISRLYIVPGISMDTKFKARTRNEIKNFEWFRVDHLPSNKKDNACKQNTGLSPNAFFMVIPFMKGLRRFINENGGMLATTPVSEINSAYHTTAVDPVPARGPSGNRQNPTKETKPNSSVSQESKLRQKNQFAQQMQLEYQEYVGHREFKKSAAATDNATGGSDTSRSESMSPRRPPASTTPNTSKQIQILKREGAKSGKTKQKTNAANLFPDANGPFTEQVGTCLSASPGTGFVQPKVWTNFHLDIDAILAAMFPSTPQPQLYQPGPGRGSHQSRMVQSAKTS